MELIDTHAHLDDARFEGDREDVLRRAREAGVCRALSVGTDAPSSARCAELAEFFPALAAAAGIHPIHWSERRPGAWERVRRLARHPRVVAVGETGLDFHHDYSDPEQQVAGFRRHIRLAREVGKPLIVHARKSDDRVLTILREEAPGCAGVRHCFDRPWDRAEAYLDLGFHLAVGAAAGRPGYKRFKEALRRIPAERLLLETDCPYQTPASREGRNEPVFVVDNLKAAAEVRSESPEALARTTTANARRLFFGEG